MRLLLDEQISGKVAERLRARGHDVVAVTSDPSVRGLADPEVFAAAQARGRAVITYNRDDFLALAADYGQRRERHHGLVIVNPKRIPNRDFSLLASAIERFTSSRPAVGRRSPDCGIWPWAASCE